MNLEIVGVRNAGELDKERVVLRVKQNCDLSEFLIRAGMFPANGRLAEGAHEYQFPARRVQKGQIVRLYTQAGTDGEQLPVPEKGSRWVTPHYHDFYWNLSACVWNRTGDTAYLLRVTGLQSFDVKPGQNDGADA